jgi:hypothetical protein
VSVQPLGNKNANFAIIVTLLCISIDVSFSHKVINFPAIILLKLNCYLLRTFEIFTHEMGPFLHRDSNHLPRIPFLQILDYRNRLA